MMKAYGHLLLKYVVHCRMHVPIISNCCSNRITNIYDSNLWHAMAIKKNKLEMMTYHYSVV